MIVKNQNMTYAGILDIVRARMSQRLIKAFKISRFIIRLTHANVWESMGKPCSCVQYIKSRIFLLQVTRERISTTSHARIRIWYYKSRVCV